MRIENSRNYKKFWLCYKIIPFGKIYFSFFIWEESHFVIFKFDYYKNFFFTVVIFNLTVFMIFKGKLKNIFGVKLN